MSRTSRARELAALRSALLGPDVRGHPCRDCGRYYDEHPVEPTDAESATGQASCEGWR